MSLPKTALATSVALLAACPASPRDRTPPLVERSIESLQAALASGGTTSRALVRGYLARIAAYDRRGPRLAAILRLSTTAFAEADALDRERRAGRVRGPLHGIPILIKDNFDIADMPTSGGALALATLRPSSDAEQVARLRAAGAIVLGKTAMHELAAGTTTISSLTGRTRDPYDPRRSPGGSSGGTGAAVAASFAAAGMGTDTCGSIRIPAAHGGLYGLRPTAGLGGMAGIMPLSPTQDVAGPIARTPEDLGIMLDATVAHVGSYHSGAPSDALRGARIGVLRSMAAARTEDAPAKAVFDWALATLRTAGAVVIDVDPPGLAEMVEGSSVIAFEFKGALAAYLAHRPAAPVPSLGEIVARGLDHAALDERLRRRDATSPDDPAHAVASAKRRALRALLLMAMNEAGLDALLYPTTLRPPPLLDGDDPGDVPNCQLAASVGFPALAFPAGVDAAGLPVGLELLARPYAERRLLDLARSWERVARWRTSPFSTPELIRGRAPRPLRGRFAVSAGRAHAVARVVYDQSTATLSVAARVSAPGGRLLGLSLHRAGTSGLGPVLETVVTPEAHAGAVSLFLTAGDREALRSGRLYLQLFTTSRPLGGPPAFIRLPSSRPLG